MRAISVMNVFRERVAIRMMKFLLCTLILCIYLDVVSTLSMKNPKFDHRSSKGSLKHASVEVLQLSRRGMVGFVSSVCSSTVVLASSPKSAFANDKSRTQGYDIQHNRKEWRYMLSQTQYDILRNGQTERPYSSILEGEERQGIYSCAGCTTPLFESSAKFHSGTGWPSFATSLSGVEIEDVNPFQLGLAGAELRCKSCGGNLGDVFLDGFLFINTPAFVSGKRFCIDGSALVFNPIDGSETVLGDLSPPPKAKSPPGFLDPPKINPR